MFSCAVTMLLSLLFSAKNSSLKHEKHLFSPVSLTPQAKTAARTRIKTYGCVPQG